MKYFLHATEIASFSSEELIEFQPPHAEEEFWDKSSIYMTQSTLAETGFKELWFNCVRNDLLFDTDTISLDDLHMMKQKAAGSSNTVLALIDEFIEWAEPILQQTDKKIVVIWEFERELARRHSQR